MPYFMKEWDFEDNFFPGLKNTTVSMRKGSFIIAKGPFNFVARNSGDVLPVNVTDVTVAPFDKISDELIEKDGKGGRDQTFADMSLFYAGLTKDTNITVLEYELIN